MKKTCDQYKLYRCKINNVSRKYYIATTGAHTFYIIKNAASKHFRMGNDYSFYASLQTKGLFRKKVLHPIDFEVYLKQIERNQ